MHAKSPSKLALALAVVMLVGAACDSGSADPDNTEAAATAKNTGTESALATKARGRTAEIRKALEAGENAKYKCVSAIKSLEALKTSSEASDKESYVELEQVCFVEQPKALIAEIRKQISDGETLKSTVAVSLKTVVEADGFPTEGAAVAVADDARKVMDVEIPVHQLRQYLAKAKDEMAAGKKVSTGCIKAKLVVEKSGEALRADSSGKEAVEAYETDCGAK